MWTRSGSAPRAAAAILIVSVICTAAVGSVPRPARAASAGAATLATSAPDPAALVNTLIGTRGGGNTFPGADTPFGMLQWSPDTTNPTDGGGFSGRSSQITGFSLTHMSGPGCRAGGDVPVLPTLGAVRPAATDSFRQSRQTAQAGYYAVRLDDGIGVELTATTRTGLARISFPSGRGGNLIFRLNGSQNGDSAVTFRRDSATLVQGSVTSRTFSCGDSKPYTLYFEMRFSRPSIRHGTFAAARTSASLHARPDAIAASATGPLQLPATIPAGAPGPDSYLAYHGKLPPGSALRPSLTGTVGAYVSFRAGAPVLAKVGISYVSAANAAANLAAEDPGWSLTATRAQAQAQWSRLLGKITVTGESPARRVVFYTALYHALLAPSVFSDDNGEYRGADGQVHQLAGGQTAEYTNFSGWDIYRSQAQLAALLDPAVASGAAQSLVNAYDQTGMLPRWQSYGRESYVMVGDPADAIIADYYAFGATGFDASAALAAMIRQATTAGNIRPGLNYLNRLGYLPQNGSYGCCNYQGSVATTLEYDTADFAISALAGSLGDTSARASFAARAQDWHNLVNHSSKLMQPRLANKSWSPGFRPTAQTGFVEGDSTQYTGMVPFDVAGLAAAKRGRAAMTGYLNKVLAGFRGGATGPSRTCPTSPVSSSPGSTTTSAGPTRLSRPSAASRTSSGGTRQAVSLAMTTSAR